MKVISHIKDLCDDTGKRVPYGVPFEAPPEILRILESKKQKNGVQMITVADDKVEASASVAATGGIEIIASEAKPEDVEETQEEDVEEVIEEASTEITEEDPEVGDTGTLHVVADDKNEADGSIENASDVVTFTCSVEGCDFKPTPHEKAYTGHMKYKHPEEYQKELDDKKSSDE